MQFPDTGKDLVGNGPQDNLVTNSWYADFPCLSGFAGNDFSPEGCEPISGGSIPFLLLEHPGDLGQVPPKVFIEAVGRNPVDSHWKGFAPAFLFFLCLDLFPDPGK